MNLRVALVHDWLTNEAGGEQVLWQLHQLYPEAPIYTSVHDPERTPKFKDAEINTSFLQHWPWAQTKHQLYSRLRPMAFESFDFSDYDLVISTTSAESKGVITSPGTTHICYLFTPTRYYWSGYAQYQADPGFGLLNPVVRLLAPGQISKLRQWDYAAAQRPDYMIGISKYVNQRIKKYYHREADLIYPPVELDRFDPTQDRQDFYLVVSRLVPYKQVELAVLAANKLNRKLVVVGEGSERPKLEGLAGSNVTFRGRLDDASVAQLYATARALIFTPEEDFGITPLEAMASGCPVIAYGKGGALETVTAKTGIIYDQPQVESVVDAMKRLEAASFDAKELRLQAEKFSDDKFRKQFQDYINRVTS